MELTGEKILSYPPESQVILNTFLHKIVSTAKKLANAKVKHAFIEKTWKHEYTLLIL
jgi:hypothetical protein